MLNVGPRDSLGIFTVISNYYGDSGIVSSHAVDEILKFIITQESFGSYGNKGTDIVFYKERRRTENKTVSFSFLFLEGEGQLKL